MVGAGAALAILASMLVLAGCTPEVVRVTAVRSADGQPSLLIAQCEALAIARISIYTAGSTPGPKWTINRYTGQIPSEVRLPRVPSGWTAITQSLTEFAPGTEYEISVYGRRKAQTIRFTLADVASLSSDEVLVGRPADKAEVVTESQFRKEAKRFCD